MTTAYNIIPSTRMPDTALPDAAKNYLQQAIESKHAPDGCLMLCNSAVDAMLKARGFNDKKQSIHQRIKAAAEQNVLTSDMADWAQEVRIGSNNPRHADEENPHATAQDAENALEYASTLGSLLFELPKRIETGRARAAVKPDAAE